MQVTFSSHAFAKAAAFLSILGLVSARGDTHLCDGSNGGGPYRLSKLYGKSQDDIAFCDTKWDQGISMTGISMWATKGHVKGVQITYSDGSKSPVRGSNTDTEGNDGNWYGSSGSSGSQSMTWKDTDLLNSVNLAANYWGNGDGLGMMTMDVAGQKFNVKSDVGSFAGEPQDVGSGILLGVYGSAGGFVNSFGLVFLDGKVVKSQIVDMQFPQTADDMNKQQTGVTSVSLATGTYKNSSPAGSPDQQFYFTNTKTVDNTHTVGISKQHTVGEEVDVEVDAKVSIPFVASVDTEITNKLTYQFQHIDSTTDASSEASGTSFRQRGVIKAGRAAVCSANSLQGHYSTDYTYVIEIATDAGHTWRINRKAHFDMVGYTQAVIDCKDIAISDLAPGNKAVEIGTVKASKRAIEFSA